MQGHQLRFVRVRDDRHDRDGKIDLVLTRDECAPDPDIGRSKWIVFPNEESGFGAARAFSLPPGYFDDKHARPPVDILDRPWRDCYDPSSPDAEAYNKIYNVYSADMTRDDKTDLLVTADQCHPDRRVGKDDWMLFENTGAGFGAGRRLRLPSLPEATHPLIQFGLMGDRRAQCAYSSPASVTFHTFDLGGDRLPDFLLTGDECTPGSNIGKTVWTMFPMSCGQ